MIMDEGGMNDFKSSTILARLAKTCGLAGRKAIVSCDMSPSEKRSPSNEKTFTIVFDVAQMRKTYDSLGKNA